MRTEPRVALVHDWLTGLRGGEKVLEAICEMFPSAEIFTLFHEPGSVGTRIESHRIHASFLNRVPLARRHYRRLLPLFPLAIESFDLGGFDLVISTSHCVAKGVIPPPDAPHLCYCLTPVRYAWDKADEYLRSPLAAALASPFLHYLRLWDVASSARVDRFVAISQWVKARVAKYYRRDAEVVHPGVDTDYYHPPDRPGRGDYYLAASALVPYKRIDLAIRACERLKRPLVVAGSGPEERALRRLAGPSVRFAGRVSDESLRDLYRGARAYLFPGEEDYGIQPIEAMACGTPVIAYGRGGATETVSNGETGLHFSVQSADGLAEAILSFEKAESEGRFSRESCRARALRFSRERFRREFSRALEGLWGVSRGPRPGIETRRPPPPPA